MNDLTGELARLRTEHARHDLNDLDTRSTREVVAAIAKEDATVPAAVETVGETISAAVDIIVERLRRGGRLIYVGAGTPGRLGVLDAAECVPTFGTDPGLVVAVMAGGPGAATQAIENAEDNEVAAERDLTALEVGPDDVIVAITASGRTPYALGAAKFGNVRGAATVGISNNPGSRLSEHVGLAIEVDTGPEIIAGSTRMKAGTAQKLVLNALSTATMVRLGKTYGNLMVDVHATNEKLRSRTLRIVTEATGKSPAEAALALGDADGDVKTAIVALLTASDSEAARALLDASKGAVRAAVAAAAAERNDSSTDLPPSNTRKEQT